MNTLFYCKSLLTFKNINFDFSILIHFQPKIATNQSPYSMTQGVLLAPFFMHIYSSFDDELYISGVSIG